MILFLRSSDISIDPRLLRFCKGLKQAGLPHVVAYWDREGRADHVVGPPIIPFSLLLGYASRRATAFHLLRANLFFMATLWRERRRITLVHAVDFDTVLAAWAMNRLVGLPFVYDVYDHYADSRGLTSRVRGWLDKVERRVIRDASSVILADSARREQHGPIPPEKLLVIENVPNVDGGLATARAVSQRKGLRIGYLGTFEARHRGLEDLITVVEADPRLEMDMAGTGAITDVIAQAAARCPRIRLHPPLRHDLGLAMLADCDIMAGLYYASVPNHRYAAPNKYYEHMLVGRPLMTSRDTPPGAKVIEHDTGWAVDDTAEAIAEALSDALSDKQTLIRKGSNAAALWHSRYADYFEQSICGHYIAMVRRAGRAVQQEPDAAGLPCRP